MSNEIDDIDSLSATIVRGNPGWLIGLGAYLEGDTEESGIGNPELYGTAASSPTMLRGIEPPA